MIYNFKDLKEEKILDPEISEKIYKLEEIENPKDYEKKFENIAYNINEKNELYNIGKIMLSLANKHDILEDINKIEDDNIKKIILSLINEKDEMSAPKKDVEQIEEKGYLFDLISYYYPKKVNKDDIQENIEKIKDDNLKKSNNIFN